MALAALDHVTIRTARLSELTDFYARVLGLRPGKRPGFSFPGTWLYCEGRAAVHLVEVTDSPEVPAPRIEHFAFRAAGLAEFLAHLRELDVAYRTAIVPDFDIPAEYIDEDYMIPDYILNRHSRHPKNLLTLKKIGFNGLKGIFTFYYNALKRTKDLSFSKFDNALDIDQQNFEEWVLKYGSKKALDYFFQPIIGGMTLGNVRYLSALYGVKVSCESLFGFWCLKNGVHRAR